MKSSERSFARRIDLTSLQLFVAVCELGSIGRAAEREFIAASAVSKRLSDLETAVDTALLYRHSRGVTLTPAGESLLHHARTVLFGLERMQGELSEYADGVRGHVRMHANISAIFQFLPEDLGAFAREHSQIKIDLQEHLSSDVLHAVQEGAADLGICNVGMANGGGALALVHEGEERCVRDLRQVVVPRGDLLFADGVGDAVVAVFPARGGRVVVGGGHDGAHAPNLAARLAQAFKRLGAGDFVHQMAVDVEDGGAVLFGVDNMLVPDLVVQGASHGVAFFLLSGFRWGIGF